MRSNAGRPSLLFPVTEDSAKTFLTSDRNAMSLSYNCDGVPVFQSSNFSIWPLQAMLNELPPQKRKRHVFLIRLWFGSSKPNIAAFLDPFTSEMRRLGSVGMKWLRDGVEVCSKVFACICSCDSVARALLQNIHQFNGICGCSWCYNPGVRIQKGLSIYVSVTKATARAVRGS